MMKPLLTTGFATALALTGLPGLGSSALATAAADESTEAEVKPSRKRGGFVTTTGTPTRGDKAGGIAGSGRGDAAPKPRSGNPGQPTLPGVGGGAPGSSGNNAGLPSPIVGGGSTPGGAAAPGPIANPTPVPGGAPSGAIHVNGTVTGKPGGALGGGAVPNGSGDGSPAGGGNDGGVAGGAFWADGVWVRPFDAPQHPVNVIITGESPDFTVTSEEFGDLRVPTFHSFVTGEGALLVDIAMAPMAHGYDMTFTIENPTAQSQPLPAPRVYGHRLGADVDVAGLPYGLEWVELQWTPGENTVYTGNWYPEVKYAPVTVMRDSELAMGVSLLYPVLDYKHNIFIGLRRLGNWNEWGWFIGMDGDIGPGETRVYTVTVRFTRRDDWIHTLEPYRDYLWSMYGSTPHYEQDLQPVLRAKFAAPHNLSSENPRGFADYLRPDVNGWTETVENIIEAGMNSGAERVLLWAASGLYLNNGQHGLPTQVMTEWTAPMVATGHEFLQVEQAGFEFGFWSGHAGTIAFEWDPVEVFPLDITNPAHVQIKKNEIQLARERGATWIGLDSFRELDVWNAVPWITYLWEEFPGLRMVSEPTSNDILHLHVPMVISSNWWQGPSYLADYLVPGRETWCWIRDEPETLARYYQLVGWGATPLLFGSEPISSFDLQPAIQMAQNGWVLDEDDPLPIPTPLTYVGD